MYHLKVNKFKKKWLDNLIDQGAVFNSIGSPNQLFLITPESRQLFCQFYEEDFNRETNTDCYLIPLWCTSNSIINETDPIDIDINEDLRKVINTFKKSLFNL